MAECPLPKPNTRVRFPSPAPKALTQRREGFFEQVTVLRIRARPALAANLQSKFAPRLCYNRGLV